ncbi:unnamed protein product [Alopecurus aequalis]
MARKNRGKAKAKTPPFSTSALPPPPVKPKPTATIDGLTQDDLSHALDRLSVADLLPAASFPSAPLVEPKATVTIDALGEDHLRDILRRLSLADLLRAALACHRWRRVAARCLPTAPPLLGYFFHPAKPSLQLGQETGKTYYEPVFAPLNASSPRLSLDFAPDVSRYELFDCHQGLLLLEPSVSVPKVIHPRLLVLDPATHRRALLPPPPRDTVPDDHIWRSSRYYIGSALLSRAHPSKLCFDAVCFAIDGGHPRAWVASFDDDQCRWRALPLAKEIIVDFDPWWFETRCVHAAGKMYWHICHSVRVLVLDPATLQFSYLLAPAGLPGNFCKYRIGETPDGRLCVATVEDQVMRLWVRGGPGAATTGGFWRGRWIFTRCTTRCRACPGTWSAGLRASISPTSTRGRNGGSSSRCWGTGATRSISRPASWSAWRPKVARNTGTPSAPTSWHGRLRSLLKRNGLMASVIQG